MSSGHGYIDDKDAYVRRLKRIEGQARGLQRMVEDEAYCIDILTQVTAMKRALEAVSLGLLNDHMNHCVVGAARESDEAAAVKIDEAMKAISRLVKS
ncbi:metal-sensitive transcriptional regulator [Gordonia caeni]|uniref:Metal-sensitive transcriptional regulator n=1 Tax=Gordonia caeni TaxID=1007097 RepID=A0ABP7NLB2_9ACTN